jgi:hypothetical protein
VIHLAKAAWFAFGVWVAVKLFHRRPANDPVARLRAAGGL